MAPRRNIHSSIRFSCDAMSQKKRNFCEFLTCPSASSPSRS
ncbi:unnamed protein product [Larinioides sclopetarius]|uniref:Uncharacterized protein n=1 Tax=Larinioides sclopetarius TaxID=280406 RepID=A0AAV1YSW8_9ARAC